MNKTVTSRRFARFLAVLMTALSALPLGSSSPPPQPAQCNGITFLWQHVYNPQRLEVKKSCVTVTGIIASRKPEPDGDLHIRLKLDSQFEGMLNEGNNNHQGGNLVVEPICDHTVSQSDAVAACETFHSAIPRYPVGTRVAVIGSYVLDHEHGWMEIHPVVRITPVQ